jgi:hypothetical protein
MASMYFWAKLFLNKKNWENSRIFLVLDVNSTKFPIFWLNFTNISTPNK